MLFKFLKISYVPFYRKSPFGCHRHCGSEDIMFYVWHMILQDYMVKGSCDFASGTPHGKSPPSQVWWS